MDWRVQMGSLLCTVLYVIRIAFDIDCFEGCNGGKKLAWLTPGNSRVCTFFHLLKDRARQA